MKLRKRGGRAGSEGGETSNSEGWKWKGWGLEWRWEGEIRRRSADLSQSMKFRKRGGGGGGGWRVGMRDPTSYRWPVAVDEAHVVGPNTRQNDDVLLTTLKGVHCWDLSPEERGIRAEKRGQFGRAWQSASVVDEKHVTSTTDISPARVTGQTESVTVLLMKTARGVSFSE